MRYVPCWNAAPAGVRNISSNGARVRRGSLSVAPARASISVTATGGAPATSRKNGLPRRGVNVASVVGSVTHGKLDRRRAKFNSRPRPPFYREAGPPRRSGRQFAFSAVPWLKAASSRGRSASGLIGARKSSKSSRPSRCMTKPPCVNTMFAGPEWWDRLQKTCAGHPPARVGGITRYTLTLRPPAVALRATLWENDAGLSASVYALLLHVRNPPGQALSLRFTNDHA